MLKRDHNQENPITLNENVRLQLVIKLQAKEIMSWNKKYTILENNHSTIKIDHALLKDDHSKFKDKYFTLEKKSTEQ